MHPQHERNDRKAVRIPAPAGTDRPATPRRVVVVGGGIAGLAAACGLLERGVAVDLIEPETHLGGRVRAWDVESTAGSVTMSRGFHAFFRQYYNLRALLRRAGDLETMLQPVRDYPVISARGDRDSFTHIPRLPPWNFMTFVLRSPTFSMKDLTKVDIDTALSLLDVEFPQTYRDLNGVSAADFLDQLRFPDRARHLALEVFARSFFANPKDFSAGELVAMFHSYFLGSAEGLLFDVPRDDFETSLWQPLGAALERAGMRRITGRVTQVERQHSIASDTGMETETVDTDGPDWEVVLENGERFSGDAVVLATGPDATPHIISASSEAFSAPEMTAWVTSLERVTLAPPFGVLRLWFDQQVNGDRPAFLGTAEFGVLDNITVLERFEAGAAKWSSDHHGSVVELHAYALTEGLHGDPDNELKLVAQLRAELARVYPETAHFKVVAQELLVERDCALIGVSPWDDRPQVETPHPGLKLAGDWVRCDLPIALMERAATTGWMAANQLLAEWGTRGHDLWSVPTKGRHRWPRVSRTLMQKLPGGRNRA